MKRMILMRHAKSDWSGGPSDDHDRPLNARGRKAASDLGSWLSTQALIPDEVLCSSAARTQETYARLTLPQEVPAQFLQSLYLATAGDILQCLKTAKSDCVLMVGHNPGIGMMAEAVLKTLPDNAQFMKYPSGATLVADFEIASWEEADWGKAIARHFVVPREL